jgi:hypothetical protein
MKKQNSNNKLAFGKATVTELNDAQIAEINGGSIVSIIVSIIVITILAEVVE